jgi:hypothetical protein
MRTFYNIDAGVFVTAENRTELSNALQKHVLKKDAAIRIANVLWTFDVVWSPTWFCKVEGLILKQPTTNSVGFALAE